MAADSNLLLFDPFLLEEKNGIVPAIIDSTIILHGLMEDEMIFEEKQYLFKSWLITPFLAVEGMFVWAVVQQIVYDIPFGDKPMGNTALLIVTAVYTLILVIILSIQIRIQMDCELLQYQFWPFQYRPRKIQWTDIAHIEIKHYKPISDFGGWGYRIGRNNTVALTLRGKEGIYLETKQNKKLLIGTSRPEYWELAIQKIRT